MAHERRAVLVPMGGGSFQTLLFDVFERLAPAALRVITRIVVGLPPVKKALLAGQVRSRFLQALAG